MRGDVVRAPSGEEIVLVDIGLDELWDDDAVRVWDVSLEPGATHPWHLHHNPYVVLSIDGSDGRMDWLDASPPRFISEYRGGAVYRPVSPVHRLTNVGGTFYRNRLIEFKDLGERLPAPLEIGAGARSIPGERPGDVIPDGRVPVIAHAHVHVWTVTVEAGTDRELRLADVPHVVAALDVRDDEPAGGVRTHPGGECVLSNETDDARTWFIVELSYLRDLDTIVKEMTS